MGFEVDQSNKKSGESEIRENTIDHDSARSRLFLAGEKLFARKGFAATSVRDITNLANCNVAAVNYHFGSKENLYSEIFHKRLEQIRRSRIESIESAMDAKSGDLSIERLIRNFSESFLDMLTDQSGGFYFVDMIVREMLDPQLGRGVFREEFIEPVSEIFLGAIRKLCPGLDEVAASRCMYSIVGQLYHSIQVMNFNLKADQKIEQFGDVSGLIDHIVEFSAGGIRAVMNGEKR